MDRRPTQPWTDLRLPYHLRPGTLIVVTGPARDVRREVLDSIWRAANGLGHGRKPLYDPAPVFTQRPSVESLPTASQHGEAALCAARAAHARAVVEPVLVAGRAVFMDGWWWDDWAEASGAADLDSGLRPTLVAIMAGEPYEGDPFDPPVQERMMDGAMVVRLPGQRADVLMGLNRTLIRAGLFGSKREDLLP